MALYESDHTKFIRELEEKHPEWFEDRLVGRAILWDRKIDLAEQQAFIEANQASRPYPYDVNFAQTPRADGSTVKPINKVE